MMNINVRQLIEEIKQRRPLWDRGHELRHERSLLDALWDEVAVICGQSQRNVKSKFKTLKDTYRKEAKKSRKDLNYRSPWIYYEHLDFLYNQLNLDNTIDLIQQNNNQINDQNTSSIDQSDTKIEFVYENVELPIEHIDTASSSSSMRGIKRKFEEVNTDDILAETTDIQKQADNYFDDEDMCFFKSLLPHIRQLSAQKKLLVRMKIQEIIYKEVYSSDL